MTEKVKRPVRRPSKYRHEYCDMVVEHMSEGASLTSFAAEIDVSRETISEWSRVHPEFSVAVKKGKAKCASWWERLGRTGAMGGDVNPTLVIFGLKNMSPEDWREKQEIDHRSGDHSMSPTRTAVDMTDDELAAIASRSGK